MAEKYEFPDELRLITDEPMEDDGWGEFSLNSEGSKAAMVIRHLAQFVIDYKCLISPTFDIEKHISILIKNRICPFDKKRGQCPNCTEAIIELQKNGFSSCGVFVDKQYLPQYKEFEKLVCAEGYVLQDKDYENLRKIEGKTRVLLKTFMRIDLGIPAPLAYHGFNEKHVNTLKEKAKTSYYWSSKYKFIFTDISENWNLSIPQINRLEKIIKSLDKLEQDPDFKIGIKVRDRLNFRSGTVFDKSAAFPQSGILKVKFANEITYYTPEQVKYEIRVLTEDDLIDDWL